MKKALSTLEAYLQSHTFLVGDAVSLADIVAFCNLYLGFTKVRVFTFSSLQHSQMLYAYKLLH